MHSLVDLVPDPAARTALVSKCPVVKVKMTEIAFPALLDTGSMVTTITVSFNKNTDQLTDAQLRYSAWLDFIAGSGLELLYLGYLELDITILGKCVLHPKVLVVKDPDVPHMQYKKSIIFLSYHSS